MSRGSWPLLCDPEAKAQIESENSVLQLETILAWLEPGREPSRITETHIKTLQQIAVRKIYPCAGNYRTALFDERLRITDSEHHPPLAAEVRGYVLDLVDRLNDKSRPIFELAAYALWRVTWIHPFAGGNGRTARALAYWVLCRGFQLPLVGKPTFPEAIAERRDHYIAALQAVDASAAGGEPDVTPILGLLEPVFMSLLEDAIAAAEHQ